MELLKTAIILFLFLSHGLLAEDLLLRQPFFQANKQCSVEKKFIYLSSNQMKEIQKKFHNNFDEQIIRHYKLECNNKISNVFILDDLVRTKYQTLLIEVKNQKINYAETVDFKECIKFKTPKQWFHNIATGHSLKSIGSIDGVSGATFTTKSNRKLLSIALYLSQKVI